MDGIYLIFEEPNSGFGPNSWICQIYVFFKRRVIFIKNNNNNNDEILVKIRLQLMGEKIFIYQKKKKRKKRRDGVART